MAAILSRNPAGVVVNEIQNLPKPVTISVNKTELKTYRTVLKKLEKRVRRRNFPRLQIIRENSENDPADNMHRIEGDILYRRERQAAI